MPGLGTLENKRQNLDGSGGNQREERKSRDPGGDGEGFGKDGREMER